ncbi:MAG: DNA polymerase III subunit delta [Lachnospiraceae bacterium]|nr:DNA polymerase III subunit delta [Lachnospiraceae bacterium]
MKTIATDIRNQSLRKIYLLCGSETYLVRHCVRMLRKAALGDDENSEMNFDSFNEQNFDYRAFSDSAQTIPFLAPYRVILLDECKPTDEIDAFVSLLEEMPETTLIIMTMKSVDKKTKLYKAVTKYGYVADLSELTGQNRIDFVAREFQKYGKGVSASDAAYFAENVGGDLYNLMNEADKVASYAEGRDRVTRADIDEVCVMQTENRIFDLIGEIAAGHGQNVMGICADLMYLKESPMRILRLLANEYLRLATLIELKNKGLSVSSISQETKTPDWLVKKRLGLIARMDSRMIRHAVELIGTTEQNIKSGDIDMQTGLEIMLADLSCV